MVKLYANVWRATLRAAVIRVAVHVACGVAEELYFPDSMPPTAAAYVDIGRSTQDFYGFGIAVEQHCRYTQYWLLYVVVVHYSTVDLGSVLGGACAMMRPCRMRIRMLRYVFLV